MKAFGNFDKVVASNGGSSMLEPGGYVAKRNDLVSAFQMS